MLVLNVPEEHEVVIIITFLFQEHLQQTSC